MKAFDVTAGGTRANEKTLSRTGIDYRVVYVHPNGHAGYYPGTAAMHLKLIIAPDDGRILGARSWGATAWTSASTCWPSLSALG